MKRYMAYSFGTLWTLVLIVALVATVIHQSKFQGSPSEINLKTQVHMLERQLDQQAMEHAAYRQWVSPWREDW